MIDAIHKSEIKMVSQPHESILNNDWDLMSYYSYRIQEGESCEIAISCGNIAALHHFLPFCNSVSNILMKTCIAYNRFQCAQILYRLGHRLGRLELEECLRISRNLEFVDWIIKKYPIVLHCYDRSFLFPTTEKHLVYRGVLFLRVPSVGMLTDMKEAIGGGFKNLPGELVHEVCLYLFSQ